ncbi:hypothetical protein Rhe02_55630 [Rhizocola hellebori]|uniref:Phage gp6-like head-tail connector protein n=1 Tax=Rhizocola hellebori TaxID=1392758 RepID=A0A8J3VIW5_9ACTN|nr:head-tail connector protein [Rhizocola hellebori]GIH07496.1 hypothetical protein Rhe02_55630 [Rhizocola hellebori]
MAWAPDYVELDDAKDFLRITHDNDDTEILLAIAAASRGVDKHTHRQFGKLTDLTLLRYRAWYNREDCLWTVNIRDIYSTTGLVVTVDGTEVAEYDLLPDDAALNSRPWERIVFRSNVERRPTGKPREIGVLGLPGWADQPAAVTHACMLQISRLHSRRESPYGVAGSPQAGGSELRLLERLDPDVAVGLKPYVRRWAAA